MFALSGSARLDSREDKEPGTRTRTITRTDRVRFSSSFVLVLVVGH